MSKEPSWLDRWVARVLSGQIAVVVVLAALSVAAFVAAARIQSDAYLQACAIEVAVGALFFLALYVTRFDSFTAGVAMSLLVGGCVLGVIGWGLSQAGDAPLVSAIFLELASAAILFFVIDLVIRGLLQAAERRNVALAKAVQSARRQVLEGAKDKAFEGVYLIFAAIDATRTREEIDEGIARAAWDPNLPEPLFKAEDVPAWSMTGMFSWEPPEETAADAESRRLGEEMSKKTNPPPGMGG